MTTPAGPRNADRIFAYLDQHGKMSARDIAADLGLTQIDIELADDAERRVRWAPVSPAPGGVGTWYGARSQRIRV